MARGSTRTRASSHSRSSRPNGWERTPRKRASSRARDLSILNSHVLPVLGAHAIGGVTRHDVQALVDGWADHQAPSTVGRQYSCLRALFAYAEATDRLTRSPCSRDQAAAWSPCRATDSRRRRARTAGRRARRRSGADDVGGRGARTPLGRGRRADRRSTRHAGRQGRHRSPAPRNGQLEPPKSAAGVRTFAVPAWLLEDLAALLSRRGLTAADGDALVFVSPDGAPLDYTNWRRRTWLPACKAAGLAGLRFHDLRSLAATALVASGADIETRRTPARALVVTNDARSLRQSDGRG